MSLIIKNLSAKIGSKTILNSINLEIIKGKVHALMGPNGSGKSTLAGVLMGNPSYKIPNPPARICYASSVAGRKSQIQINGKDILDLKTDERARAGLFLAFQNPISIPGVNVAGLLKTAYTISHEKKGDRAKKTLNPAINVWKFHEILVQKAKLLGIPQEFLRRSLNEEFSGGEKKKLEMLQAWILSPKYAIFDEIDTGLDVDALKIVASGITKLKAEKTGILIITHYLRILKYVKPDFVHILVNGEIVKSGGYRLAEEVEKYGYKRWIKN